MRYISRGMGKLTLDGRLGWGLNAAVVVGTLATIPIVVLLEQGVDAWWLRAADWGLWTIFLVEYVVESALVDNRREYWKKNWLSPVVLVVSFPLLPDLLATVRVARILRFLRFARLVGVTFRGLTELRTVLSRQGLLYMAVTTLVLILAGGAGLHLMEPSSTRAGIGDGIWWAVVTATTVGYGDISPSTLGGRLIAIVLMMSGIGLISTFSACITSYFVGQQESNENDEIRARLDRIEQLLAGVVASNKGQGAVDGAATPPMYPKEEKQSGPRAALEDRGQERV